MLLSKLYSKTSLFGQTALSVETISARPMEVEAGFLTPFSWKQKLDRPKFALQLCHLPALWL